MQVASHVSHCRTAFVIVILAGLWITTLFPGRTYGQYAKPYRILVLHSYHIGMAWEDRLNEGMLAQLRQSGLAFDIFIEYMDTKRLPKARLYERLAALYTEKYTTLPDIILATDDNAVDFLLAYRDQIFPDVPVVFSGVNQAQKARRIHAQDFTGLTETIDIKRTLDLMLKVHPDLRQVIAIADDTTSSHTHLERYQEVAAEISTEQSTQVTFTEYKNWTFSELIAMLKALPPHTALLYFSANRDRNGDLPPPAGGFSVLAHNCCAPIYTLWQTHGIGDGAVGGFVADGVVHGWMMGQYAVRILKGESVRDLPVIDDVGNRPMFDYNVLMAHHIDLNVLPQDSILINEPRSFYYRYYKVIWATCGFVMLQTLVIAILLWLINSSRRRERATLQRANAELEQRVSDRTRELERRTQDLERFNTELDQFTYVASHDLQEPVRNLVSYSTLLKEDLGGELSQDVTEDLFYITSAASRMQQLVQDLLALSRAGRAAVKTELVDLDDCVHHALDALRIRIDETVAEVFLAPLPTIQGDATLLTQLYQNLLGNALKFVGEERPVIHLTVEREADMWILGVRDNGIGLAPEYAEQIFKPFKRLHGMAAYAGTGIGLSICQKAAERHGGRIWVESEPGQGAHFRFTLPVMAEQLALSV
jgi:signal transduction histidine kinase